MYTFLSGGTGTPKLLQGFRNSVADAQIGVICNTGDDYIWNGLHISPDLDTNLYLFSGNLDLEKFWGVKDETFNALYTLKSLGADIWFNVGDKDIGLHVWRSNLLKDYTLTEVTKVLLSQWSIKSQIYPMSDDPVQSIIHSRGNEYHFQEYFVKMKADVNVETVEFRSHNPSISTEVQSLLKKSDKIIIGPSNPITSIGPLLSIEKLRSEVERNKTKTIAISPLKGGKAFSGPTVKLMNAMGIEASIEGLGHYYKDLISFLFVDEIDHKEKVVLEDLSIELIKSNIDLGSLKNSSILANSILEVF